MPTKMMTIIPTKMMTKIMLTKNVNARSASVSAYSTVEERRFPRRVPCTEVMRASAPVVALLSSNSRLSARLKN
jgi:wyosine [tRNA(Phe)-imidazoG37] synthetase (radical SAM superfamily)